MRDLNYPFRAGNPFPSGRSLNPCLFVNHPVPIILGIMGFGIAHAYFYRRLRSSWPTGIMKRGLFFSLFIFVMTFIFWKFFTRFNQFGEPTGLIAIELTFCALIALAGGFAIIELRGRGVTLTFVTNH